MDTSQWLIALPGIIGLLATTIKILADWRKGKAEATGLITDAATDVVALLRQELHDAKAEIGNLKVRIRKLETQVRELGEVPVNHK